MAHVIADRIKENASTSGTGTFTLSGAVSGFKTMASRLTTNGDTMWYCAFSGAEWEVGIGTRGTSTTLSRTTVLASSNADALVNFTNPPVVFSTLPASEIKQSADKVNAYLSSAANSTTDGWQKVPIAAAEYDTNSLLDTTNKRIVAKKPGYYQTNYHVRMGTSATFSAMLYKNGAALVRYGEYVNELSRGGSLMVYLAKDDYLELWAYAATVRAFTTGVTDTFLQVVGPL